MIKTLIKFKSPKLLYLILVAAFLIRVFPLNFPALTFEEARVAHRGYLLSTQGKDELGRGFPILFNSSSDYKLPLVTYITVLSELVFGKNDFAIRIPFVLVGVLMILVVYRVSQFLSTNRFFSIGSAFLIAFSPPLVFLSRVPNETILLALIYLSLFYFLVSNKKMILIILAMVLAVLTSKLSWFILFPFISVTLYLAADKMSRKDKLIILGFALTLVLAAFILFLDIPQAKRSLMENNFSIFSEISIKNGIEKMRVQGIASNWPPIIEKILFNKSEYLIVGILHWLSHFNPGIYFGQFDPKGLMNFSFMGAWSKVLIIPMLIGVLYLRDWNRKKSVLLFSYFIILTFPAIFMYPYMNLELIVVVLPFLSFIIALGLVHLHKKLAVFVICLVILELLVNMMNISQERKMTNDIRPAWMSEIVTDVYSSSKTLDTAVSDDLVSDIAPFIQWYTPLDFNSQTIPSPYKYRQYRLGNITVIGSDANFTSCGKEENINFFISKRDLKKIQDFKDIKIEKIYRNSIGNEISYGIGGRICLQKIMP